MSTTYTTQFASIDNYRKGGIQLLDDDPKRYVFSNIYEVAANAKPYLRTVVAKNLDYTIEVARAEGESGWSICAHDEFAVAMDYDIEVHFIQINDQTHVDDNKDGAVALASKPSGAYMGKVVLKRGHMALLPEKTAYQFQAAKPATLMIQSVLGELSAERWAEICLK